LKFTDDVSEFIGKITGKDGFIKQLNCKFLKTNILRYKSNLCIGVAPPLFWFSFFLGLVGCCGCCAIPCTFYLNRNLAVDGDNNKKGKVNSSKSMNSSSKSLRSNKSRGRR
jgi:hypothetical protein